MITKTKFWEVIREELKNSDRSKKIMAQVMNTIKDIPQDEIKSSQTSRVSKKKT
jgi:hypothetical protein